MQMMRILLVEDSDTDAALLIRFLRKEKVEFMHHRVWDRIAFTSAIQSDEYDLIIADHSMPGFSGMEAFRLAKQNRVNAPFILITGTVSEKLLTEYAKEGIDDYILKENLLRLPASIQNVINKKRLEKLYNKLEKAHKDITDSINYAKMIQEAMQPDMNLLYSVFKESFVIYKPKDIVSGDFYWFAQRDNKFIVAVADCTGHGVPGSLLSVIGQQILGYAVNIRLMTEPAAILQLLHRGVKDVLRKGSTTLRDGMDIVLCAIDLGGMKISYSGANRPLIISREGQLLELKPDKISIGGTEYTATEFSETITGLESGDRLFLFSDGYADQFHFQTGKKMMLRNLKNLLVESSGQAISQQKSYLNDYFENWKGDQEQVDDVLLFGIEIP
jgi:phosphoserine phosphatase RsbU/P